MREDFSLWDKQAIESIISFGKYSITAVYDFTNICSRFFNHDDYSEIIKIIRSKGIDGLKSLPANFSNNQEYLEVFSFRDQTQKRYIVTIYDSIALEQNPEVIEIFPIDGTESNS